MNELDLLDLANFWAFAVSVYENQVNTVKYLLDFKQACLNLELQ